MGRGVGRGHHSLLLHGEAGQTFRGLHGDLADGSLGEPFGSLKTEGFAVILQKVDGADIGAHSLRHQVDDIVEGFLEVVGVEDQPADILQCPEPQCFQLFFHVGRL